MTYYPTCFIQEIQNLAFGMSLDKTYPRSHMGLTIASIWNMKSSNEEAADVMDGVEGVSGILLL